MKLHVLAIAIVIALSYWAIRPLLGPGFFPMHDDTQVARVAVMAKALHEGQFPVRWVGDLGYGYGYPIFNFYGPLPYYVGGLLAAAGIDAVVATKLMFAIGILLSGVSMYLLGNLAAGRVGGIVGSLLYLYAPYHAVEIYVRGAVGEFWAYGFFPLFLYGVLGALEKKKRKQAAIVGILGASGIILSHTVSGFIVFLFFGLALVGIWVGLMVWKKKTAPIPWTYVLLPPLVALGLTAFFWLPAMSEMKYTSVSGQIGGAANFLDHFVCPGQLWDSPWGFGGSVPGCTDGLSFKLGKIQLLAGLGAAFLWFWQRKKPRGQMMYLSVGIGITFVSIAMMLSLSRSFWQMIGPMAYIQYPWRFLAFAVGGLSLVGALAWAGKNNVVRFAWAVFVAALIVVVNARLFLPQFTYTRPTAFFTSGNEVRYRVSKISDEYLPPQLVRPTRPSEVVRSTISDSTLNPVVMKQTDTYEQFRVTVSEQKNVTLHKAYFPGWHYRLDGKEADPGIIAGLPVLMVPAGNHMIELLFTDTPIRTFSNILSLMTLIGMIVWYAKIQKSIT